MKERRKSCFLFMAAIIGAVVGIIAFAPIWLRNDGQLMDYGDYFLQYVPFIKELKRIVSAGGGTVVLEFLFRR